MSDQDMHGNVSVGSSSKVVGLIPHVVLLTALFTHTHTRVIMLISVVSAHHQVLRHVCRR